MQGTIGNEVREVKGIQSGKRGRKSYKRREKIKRPAHVRE